MDMQASADRNLPDAQAAGVDSGSLAPVQVREVLPALQIAHDVPQQLVISIKAARMPHQQERPQIVE